MRTGTRESPSWPGLRPETGYVDADCSDLIAETPCRRGGHTFLKAAAAASSLAWWRGRAESLRNPMARSSLLIVCFETESRNSSHSHCIRSTMRQRTTPCTEGIGPSSTTRCSAARSTSPRSGRPPGALPFTNPSGPSALNRSTQSRIVWSPTPPIAAASPREPPS